MLEGQFDRFDQTFKDSPGYREHRIVHHPKFANNKITKIHVATSDAPAEKEGFLTVHPQDTQCGLSEEELKNLHSDAPVLWFSSFFHSFKGLSDGALKSSVAGKFQALSSRDFVDCRWL